MAEWKCCGDSLIFHAFLYIDEGEYPLVTSAQRDAIFRRKLPLALKAIRYGDGLFFAIHPYLDQVPIIVHFISHYSQLSRMEYWGTLKNLAI